MPAVAVGAVRLDGFFKTMSGYELEKLGKDKNEVFPSESSSLSARGKVNLVVKGVWETRRPKFASAPLAWRFSTLML